MQHSFWQSKWKSGNIGFHQAQINPQLMQFFKRLNLINNARVFVPLCGKTHDISWLLNQGYQVVGAELSELAVSQLFIQLDLTPNIERSDGLIRYSAAQIEIFVGDIFQLNDRILGCVAAIYDRAALIALPEKMRIQYAALLIEITNTAPQLLLTFDYDQQLMQGPPFSLNEQHLQRYYTASYEVVRIERSQVTGGLKGIVAASASVWQLLPRLTTS